MRLFGAVSLEMCIFGALSRLRLVALGNVSCGLAIRYCIHGLAQFRLEPAYPAATSYLKHPGVILA
jgi:hypothetical protein